MPNTVLRKDRTVYNYFRTTGFIFLLVGLGVQARNTTHGQPPARQQQAPANAQPQPQAATVSGPTPSDSAVEQPKASVETSKGDQENQDSDRSSFMGWIQVGINGALLVIIAFQTKIYWQQKTMMQRQIDNAKISERGYVGIDDIILAQFEIGKQPIIEATFLNGGRTPVWNFCAPVTAVVGQEPPPTAPPKPPGQVGRLLPAGRPTLVRYNLPAIVSPKDYAQVINGGAYLFIRGEAWFEDCWGETRSYPFTLFYLPSTGDFKGYYPEAAEYQKMTNSNESKPQIHNE